MIFIWIHLNKFILLGTPLLIFVPSKAKFVIMSYPVEYLKKEVLHALRYHFIKQPEIKVLMLVVNIYAIATAALLFMKKIRPELFLLGSVLWIILMLFFWYLLPLMFYKKTQFFKEDWEFSFNESGAALNNNKGTAEWSWNEVTHYFESPVFFHFYFGPKSFFIVPKTNLPYEQQHELRGILKGK